MEKGQKLDKEQLLAVLRDITAGIEADDSFEGRISYEAVDYRQFEVRASYRTGNSLGQGGWSMIGGTG